MRRSYGISAIAAAAALLGMNFPAGAMAPVISELPSPIIGDEGVASESAEFIYPDAFSLDTYVTDDVTTDGAIIWSYENAGGRYTINNVPPLDGGNPNSPGGARLDTQDLDPGQEDNDPRTITLRNTVHTPIGGPNTAPATSGPQQNEIVMLFASDGTTYTMEEMVIWTDRGGEDRLSSSGEEIQNIDFLATAEETDWISAKAEGGQTATLTNVNGQGLCIQVAASGSGAVVANWISPYQFIELSPMTVYRLRATVNGGTIPAGETPLWGFTVDNFSNDGAVTDNKYGAEYFVLDNVGGANNVNGGQTKDFYFTPAPVLADDWNNPTTGMFSPARDANNDARVVYRIVQASGIGYGGELDSGTLCLENIVVTAFDYDTLNVESTPYDAQTLAASTHFVTDVGGSGAPPATFAGGNVTINPPAGGWTVAIMQLTPGNADPGYPTNEAEAADNYPVVDTANGLYRAQVGAQAPTAAAETQPVDGVRVGADDVTNEVLMTSNVLATIDTLGMPKLGSVTTYTAFYASGEASFDTSPGAGRIRPRVDILCVPQVGVDDPSNNPNGITFTSMSMDKIVAPN